MADIKSALQQALAAAQPPAVTSLLSEWESDDANPTAPAPAPASLPTIQQATTMTNFSSDVSISEQTFNLIRDTPYILMADALVELTARGYNIQTTSSLIYQMIKQGMISRDMDGKLTALQKKYTPIQSHTAKRIRKSSPKVRLAKMSRGVKVPVFIPEQVKAPKGIAALNSKPAAAPAQPTLVTAEVLRVQMTAADVLETLSIKEAHVLYRELQSMFGV